MDAFGVRDKLIEGYKSFSEGFVEVKDTRIRAEVDAQSDNGRQWPDPWLSLNPSFQSGGRIDELVARGLLHERCSEIFRRKSGPQDPGTVPITLHQHQSDAVRAAATGASYVLTTGTGSGKSLAYMVPIVDRVLKSTSGKGVKAIVVYPMNALANSQMEELRKFLEYGFDGEPPVTFERYTGQEDPETRERILNDPPDILLTNYVMLDLVLTRPDERRRLINAAQGLSFLVLDELHTYRGRQGADVALLVRRLRDACRAQKTLQCIGTSATMASGGSVADQQVEVASVASRIFGAPVKAENVITETLVRSTSVRELRAEDLAAAVDERGAADFVSPTLAAGSYSELQADPLAYWIEDAFGLRKEETSGKLIRSEPSKVTGAAERLASETARETKRCETAIRATLLAGSRVKSTETGRPLFAFRLHQFLSKGGSIFTTPEAEADRAIATDFQVLLSGKPDRRLYPLAFCRECGQEYLMARLVEERDTKRFIARHDLRFQDSGGFDGGQDGYLFISADQEWPNDAVEAGRLPSSWITGSKTGHPIVESKRKRVPQRYRVAPDGAAALDNEYTQNSGQLAAWVPGAFGFCLSCQVSYESARSNEFSKVATLDREGRSSAMTVLGTRLVQLLQSKAGENLDPKARKLLTFVDNRQDASLQAGHLNDFVQVAQLRAALHRAVAGAGEDGLDALDLGQSIVNTLSLKREDYAQVVDALDPKPARRALGQVVTYRALRDLQRGWRITLPNLEQTGLLVVDYPMARALSEQQHRWDEAHFLLREADAGQREEILRVLLDEFRRSLAIEAEELSAESLDALRRRSREHLKGVWALPEREPDPMVGLVTTEPKGRGAFRNLQTITGQGAFGRWLAQPGRFGRKLSVAETNEVIASIFALLLKHGLITEVTDRHMRGYRLKVSSMQLLEGSGEYGAADPIRRKYNADNKPRVIQFFKELYKETGDELAGLRAAEHTAQVRADAREAREEAFREAELPLLFCSPTMELGVDIADLNAVAMRNVPPTPANYAQRSGRAGRSGQPALVLTYCATGNAHDTYYFDRSKLMVAGQVQPPRLDFANEDLIRSHVHAVWLAECLNATSNGLGKSMSSLLVLEDKRYPLQPQLFSALSDSQAAERAKISARNLLDAIKDELRATTWWTRDWSDKVVDAAADSFNNACERWRQLYKHATMEYDHANTAAKDPSSTKKKREEAQGRSREAHQRLEILLNDGDGQGQSDFYTYRYLASEGFLPGYSFPRLPLAAFIPGIRRGKDNNSAWLQRSRFLAISEFGPGALIYHEGARYQVKRVSLPRMDGSGGTGDVVLTEARVCDACGYLHERRAGLDVCESCGETLTGAWNDLMQLQSVITRRRERISADEEERNRQGFELVTTYRFTDHGAKQGRVDADVSDDGGALAHITYGDGATVRITNLGRSNRKNRNQHGFWLDLITGEWLSEEKAKSTDEDFVDGEDMTVEQSKKCKMVTPYVEDRRNVAVLRWEDEVTDDEAATLQYAIERGIEAVFQLEDAELTSELLSDTANGGRLLLVEAAEGGAGVLRRLQSEPDAIARVAAEALRIVHVDPETGTDLAETCVKGCYRCLLSYGNQRFHEVIDRRLIIERLLRLAASNTEPAAPPSASAPDDIDPAQLGGRGRELLSLLRDGGYNLPTSAGDTVAGQRVDFVYAPAESVPTAIIVEEEHSGTATDATALTFNGWSVRTIGVSEDLNAAIKRHSDLFGANA